MNADDAVIRSTSGGPLYALADGVTQSGIYETLVTKIGQLNSLLICILGEGAKSFNNWNDEIRENYLSNAQMLAEECKGLADNIIPSDIPKS